MCKLYLRYKILIIWLFSLTCVFSQNLNTDVTFEEHIRSNVPSKKEINVFLNENSWAQFDPTVGYVLGNYMPRDGQDSCQTISTVQSNGARTSFLYKNHPCRINTYGNSFTQCHQVSDGETWQEYLAAHIGEPVRNYGMGGFGVYQAYKRMLDIEKTDNGAEYIIFYIWGDDHIRSLLRCRYMLTTEWNVEQNTKEGTGYMFHGNFWSNIEIDFTSGKLAEKDNLLADPQSLYNMTNAAWMVENLKDDFALEMSLFIFYKISSIDTCKIRKLSEYLECEVDLRDDTHLRKSVSNLLNQYSFKATKYILEKIKIYSSTHNKKIMIVLFSPYQVFKSLVESNSRYDQDIVDFLDANGFDYFDMNLVHVQDFQKFNTSLGDYYKRYFIGHYNPAGNHFFAYSIKDKIVNWLDPKPVTYQNNHQKVIDFKNYLYGF